jgi:four helix bundle protein
MKTASTRVMIAKNLEELQVHQQALDAAGAVSAILDRPALRRYRKLREQIADCSARIPALISEGFGQKTDRHCAHFQAIARGSCNEIRSHLAVAVRRNCISIEEAEALSSRYVVIGKRLTKWIQHLERENRTRRG